MSFAFKLNSDQNLLTSHLCTVLFTKLQRWNQNHIISTSRKDLTVCVCQLCCHDDSFTIMSQRYPS